MVKGIVPLSGSQTLSQHEEDHVAQICEPQCQLFRNVEYALRLVDNLHGLLPVE